MRGRLIGLTGYAGCGKTTARDALMANGWHNVKMAGALKGMARILFECAGLDADRCIEGDLKEIQLTELMGKSPRHVMQTLGTEWGRGCIDPSLWVNLALSQCERLMNKGCDVVVDDIRFDNEAEMIRSLGGKICAIMGRGGIGGSHSSENIVSHDFELLNDKTIDNFKSLVVYVMHDTSY